MRPRPDLDLAHLPSQLLRASSASPSPCCTWTGTGHRCGELDSTCRAPGLLWDEEISVFPAQFYRRGYEPRKEKTILILSDREQTQPGQGEDRGVQVFWGKRCFRTVILLRAQATALHGALGIQGWACRSLESSRRGSESGALRGDTRLRGDLGTGAPAVQGAERARGPRGPSAVPGRRIWSQDEFP